MNTICTILESILNKNDRVNIKNLEEVDIIKCDEDLKQENKLSED